MKKALCLFLLSVTSLVSASTIPQYHISSIDANTITMTNTAVLGIDWKDFVALQGWNVNDLVELVASNGILFAPHQVSVIDGNPEISPAFLLRNVTQNEEQFISWLQEPPVTTHPGTYTITSISPDTRVIMLSDASFWTYPEDEQTIVGFWSIGDIVMIGENGSFPSSSYDAVFLNTDQQSMIRAVQQ